MFTARAARVRAKKVPKIKLFWRARALGAGIGNILHQDPFHLEDRFQRKIC
jgi:hypothetical protein